MCTYWFWRIDDQFQVFGFDVARCVPYVLHIARDPSIYHSHYILNSYWLSKPNDILTWMNGYKIKTRPTILLYFLFWRFFIFDILYRIFFIRWNPAGKRLFPLYNALFFYCIGTTCDIHLLILFILHFSKWNKESILFYFNFLYNNRLYGLLYSWWQYTGCRTHFFVSVW